MTNKKTVAETGFADVQALYQPPPSSHKGENGRLLMVVGSERYHGSAVLAAKIASRFVDLVYFCSVAENNELLREMKLGLAEFITVERDEVEAYLGQADAVLLGPGLGVSAEARELCQRVLSAPPLPRPFRLRREGLSAAGLKFILDADALKLVSPDQLRPSVLVTPHSGEFEILFGKRVPEALGERVKLVEEMTAKYRCTLVLKGPVDVIAAPLPAVAASASPPQTDSSGVVHTRRVGELQSLSAAERCEVRVKINRTGNAGMTKGGTGDVLAGLIAALACKNDLFLSGVAGAYLNGLAGDRLYERMGMAYNASDLVEEIPKAYKGCLEF